MKKTSIILGVFLLFQFKVYSQSLILDCPFEGNADDISGSMNNGTIVNGSSYIQRGNCEAIYITGDNSTIGDLGQHVLIPDLGFNGRTDFTLSLWVNEHIIYTAGEGYFFTGNHQHGWLGIANFFGSINFSVGSKINNGVSPLAIAYENPYIDTWVMYTLVYTNGTIYAYVNGVLKGQLAQTVDVANAPGLTTANAGLGMHWFGDTEVDATAFTGSFDDLRVYSYALNTSEVLELYNEDGCAPVTGLS